MRGSQTHTQVWFVCVWVLIIHNGTYDPFLKTVCVHGIEKKWEKEMVRKIKDRVRPFRCTWPCRWSSVQTLFLWTWAETVQLGPTIKTALTLQQCVCNSNQVLTGESRLQWAGATELLERYVSCTSQVYTMSRDTVQIHTGWRFHICFTSVTSVTSITTPNSDVTVYWYALGYTSTPLQQG